MRFLAALLVLASSLLGACTNRGAPVYQGYLEGEFVYVASSQGGHLERLSVSRGQRVEINAPLFALEATEEVAAVRQAQQNLSSARAQLADLQTGKRPPEVEVIRAQLVQAQAVAARDAAQLARDEIQYPAGGISQAQLEQSRQAAQSSAARVSELQNDVTVANLPGREAQRRAQMAQVDAAAAALDQARWRLEQKTVFAPRAGLVFDTIYREGEWVPAGGEVVQLLPPENLKVRFFVPEAALSGIALGARVSIECDGCVTATPATVSYISAQAEYTPPVIYSNDTRSKLVYMIEAHPAPGNAATMHPGQPVQVRLR